MLLIILAILDTLMVTYLLVKLYRELQAIRRQLESTARLMILETSRIAKITSRVSSGSIARDEAGQPLRVSKQRQLLKLEKKGGDDDSYAPSSGL